MASSRIGVISDTHGSLPDPAYHLLEGAWSDEELAQSILVASEVSYPAEGGVSLVEADAESVRSRPCDLILHAGDIGSQLILDELGAIARTVAVLGNNDYATYWCSDGEVRDLRSLTHEGVDIFMQHIPKEMEASLCGRPPLRPALVTKVPDLSVHGHTHIPRLEDIGSRIVLCPGSPSQARRGSGHAAALVDVEEGRLARIALVRLP